MSSLQGQAISAVTIRLRITIIETIIYGDERISTDLVSLGQRVEELHLYKSNTLKLTDNNRSVALAA